MDTGFGPEDAVARTRRALGRQLDEVLLLIEYVSGRPDRALADLEAIDSPHPPAGRVAGEQIVEEIGRIAAGDVPDTAAAIAFLIGVKDRLNRLAGPASGLTVAYTTMCATSAPLWRTAESEASVPEWLRSRTALAAGAYPGLIASAWWYRLFRNAVVSVSLLLALAGGYLTWEIAYGRSILQRITDLAAQHAALAARVMTLDPATLGQLHPDNATLSAYLGRHCATAKFETVPQLQLCEDLGANLKRVNAAYDALYRFQHVHLFGVFCPDCAQPAAAAKPEPQNEQGVAAVLTTFNSYLLPLVFALLGTIAAVMRALYVKIQANTLAPRDLTLIFTQLPLGLVAGVSVGLFLTPDEAPIQGAAGLTGGLTLSAPGIAFLAGYGTEAVFRLFDQLLGRVFMLSDTPSPKI